ncbi:MAG: DUF4143 domain-containing protein [Bacteroidota bacterium]
MRGGHLVESAVGAHLSNAALLGTCELFYWRDGRYEVDFVVSSKRRLTAIEVKSGPAPVYHSATGAFGKQFAPSRTLLVGGDGIPVETFLTKPIEHWVG